MRLRACSLAHNLCGGGYPRVYKEVGVVSFPSAVGQGINATEGGWMSTLARNAGPLALLGGAVWVIAVVSLMAIPSSYAWLGLIVAIVLMGGAALGLQAQVGARTGRIGRWAAIATAAGSVALIALVLIALAMTGGSMTTPPPPVVITLSFVAFVLWVFGSVVFALVLLRAKAIPPVAGWLIVLGAALGTVALFALGPSSSVLSYLPLGLYGVGWILIGFAARSTTSTRGVAGQAT